MIQVRLTQLRGGGLHIRLGGDDGVIDQRTAALHRLARAGHSRFGGSQFVACVGQFFVGDGAGGGQVLASCEVVAGALERDLTCAQFGLRTFNAAIQTAHLTHGAGQIGLRLLHHHFGIGRVQLHQQLALLDLHAVIGGDGDHGAGDQRGDLHLVACHIGVIGFFGPTAEQVIPGDEGDQQDHDNQQQAAQQLATTAGCGGCRFGGGSLAHGGSQEFLLSDSTATGSAVSAGWKPPPSATLRRTLDSSRCDCRLLKRCWLCSSTSWVLSTSR
ncbi:hypothetical protein D3C71_1136890 [compost metagenome]